MPIKQRTAPKSRHTPGQLVMPGMSAVEPNKAKREEPEFAEQREMFAFLKRYEGRYPDLHWVHAVPNGLALLPTVAKKAVEQGVRAGVFDTFTPCCRQGFPGLYVEMKYGGNDLSEPQRAFQRHLMKEGYKHNVAWHWIDAVSIILDYLGIQDAELDQALDINRKATVRYATARRCDASEGEKRPDAEW